MKETVTGYVDMGLVVLIDLIEMPMAEEFYSREDIPSKLLKGTEFKGNLEAMFVEIKLRKKKWLLSCSYNPQKSEIRKHLGAVRI